MACNSHYNIIYRNIYSSKFLWHNIFMNFVILLLIEFLTKFSIIVGVATFYVRTHAYRDRSASAIDVQTLYVYFQKMSYSCLPNPQDLCPKLPSCIESTNNHVKEMANRRQQKALKAKRNAHIHVSLV